MQNQFIPFADASTHEEAEWIAPWAEVIATAENGFMAFENNWQYTLWLASHS